MSADAELLRHVERWRRDGIPPPPAVDTAAFAEAVALSAALSVALASASDAALTASLRERVQHARDERGHSSSLRMRMAQPVRRQRRKRRSPPPLRWVVPLGVVAAAALIAFLILGLPTLSKDPGQERPPEPTVAEEIPPAEPSRTELSQTDTEATTQPQRLDHGETVLRPSTQRASLRSGNHQLHAAPGSVVEVSAADGALTAAVSSGEALLDIEGHGSVRIFANERIHLSAAGTPLMGDGQVILDLAAQPGRIVGERSGGHWQARFDPQFELMALDIERFEQPLALQGDEWLEAIYRLSGAPDWLGVYVQTEGAGHNHWAQAWASQELQAGWQTLRIPLTDLQPEGAGADPQWRLSDGGQLIQLRFQAGLSSDATRPTVLELRSLRLMAPLR
ncbi:MAG: hypothetical protein EA401_12865 [Planctomycetota bacterium]|nr:MAG: hypothetical protein EA401_12865 [Planctomycetota bacterium]